MLISCTNGDRSSCKGTIFNNIPCFTCFSTRSNQNLPLFLAVVVLVVVVVVVVVVTDITARGEIISFHIGGSKNFEIFHLPSTA